MALRHSWSEVPTADWDDAMTAAGTGDVYFARGYYESSANLEPGDATSVLLSLGDSTGTYLLPLLVRALPGSAGFDATSAYGYGGPVVAGHPNLIDVSQRLNQWARSRNVVATFLRSHPLAGNAAHFPDAAKVVSIGSTVGWKIPSVGDPMSRAHPHHRRNVRRAERAGAETQVLEMPTDLASFRALYETTMRRQGASSFYYFPSRYWRVLESAKDVPLLIVNAIIDEEVVASLLCLSSTDALHFHLGATSDLGRKVGASNLCFAAAARWAQHHKLAMFHLGGGVGGATSDLYTFKRRFDPDGPELPFHVGKLVHDRQMYRELTGGDSIEGYFPPWRNLT